MWIEITFAPSTHTHTKSRPARALWIEILIYKGHVTMGVSVEAREGLVD